MPVPPKRTFCSKECVFNWKMKTQPSFAASQVLKRDHGICVECKLDCVRLKEELHVLLKRSQGWQTVSPWGLLSPEDTQAAIMLRNSRITELGLKGERALGSRRLWEMDHILPVVEGGGLCGLDNLRTLCWKCHQAATNALRKRMTARKKEADELQGSTACSKTET